MPLFYFRGFLSDRTIKSQVEKYRFEECVRSNLNWSHKIVARFYRCSVLLKFSSTVLDRIKRSRTNRFRDWSYREDQRSFHVIAKDSERNSPCYLLYFSRFTRIQDHRLRENWNKAEGRWSGYVPGRFTFIERNVGLNFNVITNRDGGNVDTGNGGGRNTRQLYRFLLNLKACTWRDSWNPVIISWCRRQGKIQ